MRSRLSRLTLGRPRFLLAGFVVGVGFLLLPQDLPEGLRPVVAWNSGLFVYLVATGAMMVRATEADIRRRARIHDVRQWVIVLLALIGTGAIVAALVDFLRVARIGQGAGSLIDFALVFWTILSTFIMLHMLFAVHYAHAYYAAVSSDPPLAFPGGEKPDYFDFLYFSVVVGLTAQVSDVVVNSRRLRRTVLVHGIIAFFFNTLILALMVNIAAGLVGQGG
ncbi:DUF1345 domain-containing protein [Zavarzinia aquatilis]|uniref:DUF1345 domain-containing protein n=1 Tax=Zavarzinia aquatilis TaxID=2211142 RepID=A0A317DW79_9PROT|nr:DUF1345 domain-containing protein [Zavarzinia aquatilis]PWR18126.1 DUF1345 domain-containing protein [Zavarzinia aquatilis]